MSTVMIEMKPLENPAGDQDEQRIRQLAELLFTSSTTDLSTLPLRGYMKQPGGEMYAFIFDFLQGAQESRPISLHDVLSNPRARFKVSLSHHFHIAQHIVKSVIALHADVWVHKSLMSRSILYSKAGTEE